MVENSPTAAFSVLLIVLIFSAINKQYYNIGHNHELIDGPWLREPTTFEWVTHEWENIQLSNPGGGQFILIFFTFSCFFCLYFFSFVVFFYILFN